MKENRFSTLLAVRIPQTTYQQTVVKLKSTAGTEHEAIQYNDLIDMVVNGQLDLQIKKSISNVINTANNTHIMTSPVISTIKVKYTSDKHEKDSFGACSTFITVSITISGKNLDIFSAKVNDIMLDSVVTTNPETYTILKSYKDNNTADTKDCYVLINSWVNKLADYIYESLRYYLCMIELNNYYDNNLHNCKIDSTVCWAVEDIFYDYGYSTDINSENNVDEMISYISQIRSFGRTIENQIRIYGYAIYNNEKKICYVNPYMCDTMQKVAKFEKFMENYKHQAIDITTELVAYEAGKAEGRAECLKSMINNGFEESEAKRILGLT